MLVRLPEGMIVKFQMVGEGELVALEQQEQRKW